MLAKKPALSRRRLLLAAGLLAPALLVAGLGVRLIDQERELTASRQEEARVDAAERLGQELRIRLEILRGDAAADPRDAMVTHRSDRLLLELKDGQVVGPWERDPAPNVFRSESARPTVAASLREAEALEFRTGSAVQAAAVFDRLALSAVHPAMSGFARLQQARLLASAGRADASRASLMLALETDPVLTDEFGLPIALYAAARAVSEPDLHGAAARTLSIWADTVAFPNPSAVSLASSIADSLAIDADDPAVREARQAVNRRALESAEVEALLADMPVLRSLLDSQSDPSSDWVLSSGGTWFAGEIMANRDERALLAIKSSSILPAALVASGLPDSARIVAGPSDGGYWIGPSFPRTQVTLDSWVAEHDLPVGSTSLFLTLAATLVFALAGIAVWLLLRDARREHDMARLRSDFVASVSHDLKTPLTSIRMYAESLQHASIPEDRRSRYVETIVGESARLSRLLQNVLDFSQIDRGLTRYRMEPLDLRDVATEATESLAFELDRQHFELSVTHASDSVPVSGDRDALVRAVLNLMTNAMKFAGEDRRVEVQTGVSGSEAFVQIKDHGPGIPPQDLGRIFDRFYRSGDAVDRGVTGTGLGLSIVQHVATAHGGRATAVSKFGDGSTFTLHLPLTASP